MEGEASLLLLCCDFTGSRFIWSIPLCDLVLDKFLIWGKSTWVFCKDIRFSGIELSLWIDMLTTESLDLGDLLRMLSGLSTIVGGFRSG